MAPMLPRGANSLNGRADRGDRATTCTRTLLRWPHEPRAFARVFRETIVRTGKFLTKWLDMRTTSKSPRAHTAHGHPKTVDANGRRNTTVR